MKLSYSSIQSYLSCERRFEWQKIVEIETDTPAKHLRIGSAYHVALNILKDGGTLDCALAAIERMYSKVPLFISNLDEWWVEREISMRLAMGWHDYMLPLKVIASECEFTLKIRHPVTGERSPFELHGYIDAMDPSKYFQRYPVVRLDRDIYKAQIELWEQTERIRTTLAREYFLKNSQSCLSPYRCPYAGLCLNGTEPRDVRENGIPKGYRKRDRR